MYDHYSVPMLEDESVDEVEFDSATVDLLAGSGFFIVAVIR